MKKKKLVHKIIDDFEELSTDDNIGTIKYSDIKTVREIISKIPKISKIEIPKFSLDKEIDIEIFPINIKNISRSLGGWKKQVFLLLNQIEKQVLTLNDIYVFELELSKVYPNNKNIKDKIRQQLQLLRDLSLIEFLGNGKYKKLWKQSEEVN